MAVRGSSWGVARCSSLPRRPHLVRELVVSAAAAPAPGDLKAHGPALLMAMPAFPTPCSTRPVDGNLAILGAHSGDFFDTVNKDVANLFCK